MANLANETLTSQEFNELYRGEQTEASFQKTGPGDYPCALAIDPGTETGVAWSDGDRIVTGTSDFWEASSALRNGRPHEALAVKVPAPDHSSEMVVILEAVYESRQSMGAGPAIAYNSGQVAREADLLSRLIGKLGHDLIEHDPAGQPGKWNREVAERRVGDWVGPNNQHVRDAVRLLYWYEML